LRSTSCKEIAEDLLARSVAGHPPDDLPLALLDESCGPALFGILVEGLADRFEPALCDTYARLFSQAISHAVEGVDAADLVARYRRVRQVRLVAGQPREVFVLSRVTLGADVVVSSVLLAAAKQRFPDARIGFVAPHKNFELFAGDPRIHHVPVTYHRGGLRDRLAVWDELKALVAAPDSIVLDPDSRLTQLGLLPICPEDRYHFFESRAYGAGTTSTLAELAASWAAETLRVKHAKPYLALAALPPVAAAAAPYIAINLGVGENPAKRIPDPFEQNLLALLASTGLALYIDKGAGGEEAERVLRAVERSGVEPKFWDGSFAGFAQIIAGSQLYVGYDSAGQHVAAASGVPLITVFAGFPVPGMFDRWRPSGVECRVVRVDSPDPIETLAKVQFALADLRS
jgi:ADP-heptose:LPS heptosyltransferase